MRRILTAIALVFLYWQSGCLAEDKPKQYIFDYFGNIVVTNSASNETKTSWGIKAKLVAQDDGNKDYYILQLEDVETYISSGEFKGEFKPIPNDAKALLKPFVLYSNNEGDMNISCQPDEPIWSVNMKRSIGNVLYINKKIGTDYEAEESTLYGICKVQYIAEKLGSGMKVTKTIKDSCENYPRWVSLPVTKSIKRVYVFPKQGVPYDEVTAYSNMTYKQMRASRNTYSVQQYQKFKFVATPEEIRTIDISKNTVKSKIIFDYSLDAIKEAENHFSSQQVENYYRKNFKVFNKESEKPYLTNLANDENRAINKIYEAFSKADNETLRRIVKEVFDNGNVKEMQTVLSVLPYIGTNETINLVKDFVVQDEIRNILEIILLATFPSNIKHSNKHMLKDLEVLMDLNVTNDYVKHAGILSFASFVLHTKVHTNISNDFFKEYQEKYYKLFKESEEYELRMIYLLGLINMAFTFDDSYMFQIITDTNEVRHLRSLAAYGFRAYIYMFEDENKTYEQLWPIVTNKTEPFEVRVAVLDVLLNCRLSLEHFQTIFDHFSVVYTTPEEKHLANYFYTSFEAARNTNTYVDHLVYLASQLNVTKLPTYPKTWPTGKYRYVFMDTGENIHGIFEVRTVANPLTNVINTVQITQDNSAWYLDAGTYQIYIKAEGITDIFEGDNKPGVSQLLEIIQTRKFVLKEAEDFHIDIVIYKYNTALFALHLSQDNIESVDNNLLYTDLLPLIEDYKSIEFTNIENNYLVSDLGTVIKLAHEVTEVSLYQLENFNKLFNDEEIEYKLKYRSSWTHYMYFESHNPLIRTNIGVYNNQRYESLIELPFKFNSSDFSLLLTHEPDTFNWVSDWLIGSYAGEDGIVNKYCSNCVERYEVPVNDFHNYCLPLFCRSAALNFTRATNEPEATVDFKHVTALLQNASTYDVNTFNFPLAKPIFTLWHLEKLVQYGDSDLERISIRTLPYYNETSETLLQFSTDDEDEDNKNDDDDPIGGTDFTVSVTATNRRIHDAHVFSRWNATFKYHSGPKAEDAQHHLEDKYSFHTAYTNSLGEIGKVCIDREVLYPPRPVDKLSLDPVGPAKGTTTITWGVVDEGDSETFGVEGSLRFKEIYSGTEKQTNAVKAMEAYEKCKHQSKGLKYVPPTHECISVHESISRYDSGEVYLNITELSYEFIVDVKDLPTTEYGFKVLEFNRVNDTHMTINVPEDVMKKIRENLSVGEELSSYETITTEISDLFSEDPTSVAYDDYDVDLGFSSTCVVSPHTITNKKLMTTRLVSRYGQEIIHWL